MKTVQTHDIDQTLEEAIHMHEHGIIIERIASARSVDEVTSELKGLSDLEQLQVLEKAIYSTEDNIEMYIAWGMHNLAASRSSLLTYLEDTKAIVRNRYSSL